LTAFVEPRVLTVDVDRAVELYAAGWTLRRIGAELGVDHRTVAVRLHRAGVTMRRGGAPPYEVDTQRIMDLRDQGLTMTAVAAEVGMSVPGVWARYYRARPARRADVSVSTAPVRMIPWQKLLAEALIEHEVIGVRAIATAHLGHEPTRAQITAARRAAHRLVAADLARAVHVQVRLGNAARQVNHLVLVRPDAEAGHDQVLDAATCKPPAADQPARTLELSLTTLGTAARNIDVDQLSAEQAGHLAAILQAAVADLIRQARRLERRAKRRLARPSPIKVRRTCYLHIWRTQRTFGGTSPDQGRCEYPRMYPRRSRWLSVRIR
jgi:hypothetical protein